MSLALGQLAGREPGPPPRSTWRVPKTLPLLVGVLGALAACEVTEPAGSIKLEIDGKTVECSQRTQSDLDSNASTSAEACSLTLTSCSDQRTYAIVCGQTDFTGGGGAGGIGGRSSRGMGQGLPIDKLTEDEQEEVEENPEKTVCACFIDDELSRIHVEDEPCRETTGQLIDGCDW